MAAAVGRWKGCQSWAGVETGRLRPGWSSCEEQSVRVVRVVQGMRMVRMVGVVGVVGVVGGSSSRRR